MSKDDIAKLLHKVAYRVSYPPSKPRMEERHAYTIWRDGWRIGVLGFLTHGPVTLANGLVTTLTLGLYNPIWSDEMLSRVLDAKFVEKR